MGEDPIMKKHLTNMAVSLLMTGWVPMLVGSLVAALIMVALGMPANQVLVAGFAPGGAGGS